MKKFLVVLTAVLTLTSQSTMAIANDDNAPKQFPDPDFQSKQSKKVLPASRSEYTITILYTSQMEDINAGNFISAYKRGAEEDGLKDCETAQIGVEEYGIILSGKKLDDKNYVWITTERGKVVLVQLLTKK